MNQKRKKLLRTVGTPILALVLCDALLSILVLRDGMVQGWPLPPFGAITHPAQREWAQTLTSGPDGQGIGRFDAELGWSWRPSSASPDGRFHVDAMGARGTRDSSRRPPEGKTRILCFGDSFVFCDEVGDRDSFEAILERRNPRFEVLNFGVSGYGTDQALLRYRRLGRGLGAEVVCMGLLLENIGRNVNRYRPLWNPRTGFCATKPRFVLEAGRLRLLPQPYGTRGDLWRALEECTVIERVAEGEYWLGRPRVPTGRLSSMVRLAAGYLAYTERSPERLWRETDGEPFAVTVALLETFHDEARRDGARYAPILIFPMRQDLEAYVEEGTVFWSGLFDELERRGIPYLDLITPLADYHRQALEKPSMGHVFSGGHLSPLGNTLVADALGRWLSRR